MRIHHVALRTLDLDRLEKFYVGVVGLEVLRRGGPPGGNVWLGAGAAVVMLERAGPDEPPIPAGTMDLLAFAVESPGGPDPAWKEAWRARIEQAGGRVEGETAHTIYFRDPDGRRVAWSVHPLV